MRKKKYFSLADVLKEIGISRATLYRWLQAGKIEKPKRNGRGYLFWDRKQLQRLKNFVRRRYTPQ